MESDGEGMLVEKAIAKEVTKELAMVKIRRKNIPNSWNHQHKGPKVGTRCLRT